MLSAGFAVLRRKLDAVCEHDEIQFSDVRVYLYSVAPPVFEQATRVLQSLADLGAEVSTIYAPTGFGEQDERFAPGASFVD